jgi:hypothetical protein
MAEYWHETVSRSHPKLCTCILLVLGSNINLSTIFPYVLPYLTASVVLCADFLAANPEVPGSIPDANRFSE